VVESSSLRRILAEIDPPRVPSPIGGETYAAESENIGQLINSLLAPATNLKKMQVNDRIEVLYDKLKRKPDR
jgi:hypothetical protein